MRLIFAAVGTMHGDMYTCSAHAAAWSRRMEPQIRAAAGRAMPYHGGVCRLPCVVWASFSPRAYRWPCHSKEDMTGAAARRRAWLGAVRGSMCIRSGPSASGGLGPAVRPLYCFPPASSRFPVLPSTFTGRAGSTMGTASTITGVLFNSTQPGGEAGDAAADG